MERTRGWIERGGMKEVELRMERRGEAEEG
jgi:hypothetical protein